MKQPNIAKVLLASSLTLAFASTLVTPAHAELVSEDVQADSITPQPSLGQSSGMQDEVVILKKSPQKVTVRETSLPAETIAAPQPVAYQAAPAAAPVAAPAQAQAQATATATATASARPSVGSSLDQGMSNKMDDVRNQFENALLRTLDRIKITVDDGAPGAAAQATATAQATAIAAPAAPVAAPTTTIVRDNVINATAAPANYMTVDSSLVDEEEGSTSVADREDHEERTLVNRIRVAPVVGMTSIGGSNSYYDIKSSFTAGINIEMEVAENFAAYLGYSYSKYDVGLAGGFGYGGYGGYGYGGGFSGYNPLQYNQNLFEAGGRFYILPRESAFRVFVGGGIGLNKGYINYRNNGLNGGYGGGGYAGYGGYGGGLDDYELTSWLGILETGAEFRVSRGVSIGANFKYMTVLSSRENDRLRAYGFYSGYNGGALTQEQLAAGSSIANESLYSILGTVKVAF